MRDRGQRGGKAARVAACAVWVFCVLAAGLLFTTAWAQNDSLERRAHALEGKFMAPCCGANTLDVHESGPAQRMKAEIRTLLAEGRTEAEVIEVFVARHGPQILSAPPASGFNLVPYLVPAVFFVIGVVVLWGVVRRWSRATPTPSDAPDDPQPRIDPAYRERLEREIGRYG